MSFHGVAARALLVCAITIIASGCASGSRVTVSSPDPPADAVTSLPGDGVTTLLSAQGTGSHEADTSVPPTSVDADAGSDTVSPSGGTDGPPTQPVGLFINTGELSLTGTGEVPTAGHSECQTSPGATCEIRFDGAAGAYSLTAKPVDTNGRVSWDWSPHGLGMETGHYDVTVIARRHGHSVVAGTTRGLMVVD